MRAHPLVVNFHENHAPIYSVHFEPNGKGRLATGGGDNSVRLWRVEAHGEDRKVVYLSTLVKHTQAVNVVRFCPRGEMLASAGDDGNVLLWVPSETQHHTPALGDDGPDEKETWRIKHMCRSSGSEIYDLAWSPDGVFFITGSMDNIARIYNAQTGQTVRQIAEHNHYVQGVAWDPMNEFVATQSSDRSVHIYTLKTKDGHFSLAQHGKITKMDLPARRISSNSPAPPDLGSRPHFVGDASSLAIASPAPSAPGTPNSLPLPMNPPALTHSRRSSFSSSPSMRRSTSPAPSLPLPAVKPMEASPKVTSGLGVRNANIYANETFTSFFRRLTFAPDGSLLFTPAGQYKTLHHSTTDSSRTTDDVLNTVYIYTRAGFNKPPVAHLPGHKKPAIAVKCSPLYYTHRKVPQTTKHITVDTSSAEDTIPSLPEPAIPSKAPTSSSTTMDPPPLDPLAVTPIPSGGPTSSPNPDAENGASTPGPTPAFALPYRIVYAVATQDAILVYDTQQQTPLCIVSNLHFATFTDLTWSTDGSTLLMSSSDGFCSTLAFSPGELGQIYTGSTYHIPAPVNTSTASSSAQTTPVPTPTSSTAPPLVKQGSNPPGGVITSSPAPSVRPGSPTRSESASSSVATPSSQNPLSTTTSNTNTNTNTNTATSSTSSVITSNPTPTLGSMPGVTVAHSGGSTAGGVPLTTPPQTPMSGPPPGPMSPRRTSGGSSSFGKRDASASEATSESDREAAAGRETKKRRIAPTLVQPDGKPDGQH
ncbi:MAG: hypothetical protein M4579_007186 [Chaenotheca gracillima]|nr:MAG: hypothetical protein M4579_007186 [Chaenotheca gracillima]